MMPGRNGKVCPWSLVLALVEMKGEKMAWGQRKERQLVDLEFLGWGGW